LPSAWPDESVLFAVDPFTASTVYVGTAHGVMVTTDGGEHWDTRTRGITRATTSVVFHDGPTRALYATTGRQVFTSLDKGASWTALAADAGVALDGVSIGSDGDHGVLASTSTGVMRLRRGQRLWTPDVTAAGAVRRPMGVASGRVPRILTTTTGEFSFSVDGGSQWRTGRMPTDVAPGAIAVAAGGRGIYAATGGILGGLLGHNGIWRSLDDTATWQRVDLPGHGTVANCCGLLADPHDPDTVYSLLSGMAIGGGGIEVGKTADGGVTWVMLPGLSFVESFDVVPTTPTTLLARVVDHGGTGGYALMRSTDGGDHWTRAGEGLPESVLTTGITSDPRRPAVIFAGTYGRGVFRSDDAGATWGPTGVVRELSR
jgi:hypothetical protein